MPGVNIQQLPRQVETFQLEDSRDNAAGKAAAPIGLFPGKQQKRLMNKYEKVDGNYDYQIPLYLSLYLVQTQSAVIYRQNNGNSVTA